MKRFILLAVVFGFCFLLAIMGSWFTSSKEMQAKLRSMGGPSCEFVEWGGVKSKIFGGEEKTRVFYYDFKTNYLPPSKAIYVWWEKNNDLEQPILLWQKDEDGRKYILHNNFKITILEPADDTYLDPCKEVFPEDLE